MKKKVPVVKITTPNQATELASLPMSATVAMADVADAMREGLLAFSTAAGLVVMQQMLTDELASIVGAKHSKQPTGERVGNWHGSTNGQVGVPVVDGRDPTVSTRPVAKSEASGPNDEHQPPAWARHGCLGRGAVTRGNATNRCPSSS